MPSPIINNGYCSPERIVHHKSHGSCLSLQELQTVATIYNNNILDKKKLIPQSMFNTTEKLVKALDQRFHKVCHGHKDYCWLEQPLMKKTQVYNKLKDNYRPEKPQSWEADDRQWLNTLDILHVMKQYENSRQDKASKFKFLGVFPIDFAQQITPGVCVARDMCNFNIISLISEGYDQAGIVFNLDKHNQPGSHWVAAYINLNPESPKFGLCYYDSAGLKPRLMIMQFLTSVYKQMVDNFPQDISKKIVVKYNPTKQQFLNTECGIFSMTFLILCLEKQFESYRKTRNRIKKKRDDGHVHKLRNILFRPIVKLKT